MNLRTLKALAVAAPLLVAAAACTDPTVAPKSTVTGANIWNDPNSYSEYMAKLYGGLILTSQVGPNASSQSQGDIPTEDEGTSEYLRVMWYLEELPTDEAVIGWNDPGVPDLNLWSWTSTNAIANCMYYRVYFQVDLANEFLRQTTAAALASRGLSTTLKASIQQYRAEARFLRAMAYWNGIDFFGSIPFVTENDPVGGPPPKQASRDSIYRYVVSELKAIQDSLPTSATAIPLPGSSVASVVGRATPAVDHMLLAELYLNAGVYTGTTDYADALTEAGDVINNYGYSLDQNYRANFTADNLNSPEIIFAAVENGTYTQTWGGMTFVVHAGCGGSMQASWYGIDYCWGGYRLKQNVYHLFDPADARRSFFYDSAAAAANGDHTVSDSVIGLANFNWGAAAPKFTNLTSTGAPGSQESMVDASFPVFRLGEAYLIYAEAAVRTGTNVAQGVTYFNDLRDRAFNNNVAYHVTAATMTLDTILAERAREMLFESRRRTDLIRFGQFAGPTATMVWALKGGSVPGVQVTNPDYNLYPLPANELTANPNLKQNPGY